LSKPSEYGHLAISREQEFTV